MKNNIRKLLQTIKHDFYKNITTAGPLIGIVIGIIITGMTGIYTDTSGKVYNVFKMAGEFSREQLAQMNMYSENVLSNIFSSLAPYGMALTAFAFVFGLYAEKQNKTTKYIIYRTGINKYIFSKAIVAFISSVFMMGFISLIYVIYVHLNYPSLSAVPDEWEFRLPYYGYTDKGRKLWLVTHLGASAQYVYIVFGMMIYGGFCSAIGFLVYAFTHDIYLNICMPFFVGYSQNVMVTYLLRNKPQIGEKANNMGFLNYYLKCWRLEKYMVINIIVFLAVWIIAIVVNIIRIRSMRDYGGDV